jgi:hypothetical protein
MYLELLKEEKRLFTLSFHSCETYYIHAKCISRSTTLKRFQKSLPHHLCLYTTIDNWRYSFFFTYNIAFYCVKCSPLLVPAGVYKFPGVPICLYISCLICTVKSLLPQKKKLQPSPIPTYKPIVIPTFVPYIRPASVIELSKNLKFVKTLYWKNLL